MPSNEELSNRAKSLVTDVQSITQSAKQHVDEYKALATKTYANLQKFLESKGVKSVDEWLAKAQKELTPEEAAKVQKAIKDLQPPQGLAALTEPAEIAKFMAGWYITQGAIPLFQTAALTARSWFNNYLAINRLPVVAADGIELTSIASTTELAEAATLIEGDEVATMMVATEAELGSIVAGEAAVAAEVAGVAAAEAACSWNIFLVAAGAVVLAGVYAWQKHRESEDAEKLKGAIAEIATARLYALASEQSILKQTDQKSVLFSLNMALEAGENEVATFFKDHALKIAKDAATAINVNDCYNQLHQQDENNHAMTDADPSYDDMVHRHEAKLREGAPNVQP